MTATDGTPDATSNLCCTETTGPMNGGSQDASKKVGPSGCTDTVSTPVANTPKYYQARIQALPIYTEITVEDPWLETLNAVGGILALIDGLFLVIVGVTRGFCEEDEVTTVSAPQDYVHQDAGVQVVEMDGDGPAGQPDSGPATSK